MTCTVCGGPLGKDILAGREWLKCTRCGAWAGTAPEGAAGASAMPGVGADAPLPAALVQQPIGAGTGYEPSAWQAAPPAAAPAQPQPPSAGGAPTPQQVAEAARVLVRAGMLAPEALAAGARGPGQQPSARPQAPVPPPDLSRVPRPPRRPSPAAKSLIFAYQGSQRIKLIVGVLLFVVGTLGTLPLTWTLPGEIALALSATPGKGTVVSIEENPNLVINHRRATKITFRYAVDGTTYEESVNTTSGRLIAFAAAHEKDLPIEYAAIAPGVARIQGGRYSVMGWPVVFFLIGPLVGLLLWISAWRSNRREIRAFRHGTPTVGRIVERTFDASVKSNGRSPRVVRWAFEVARTEYTGELSHMNWDLLDSALPGPWVIVLYDPADPKKNTVWIA